MPPEMGRMQRFAADLLAQQGALVEPIEPEGLEVLASSPVQQALGVNEFFRVGFGATLPAGATRVGIESDWLERFGHLLGQHGRGGGGGGGKKTRAPPPHPTRRERRGGGVK